MPMFRDNTDSMLAYFDPSSEGREHRAERLARDLTLAHKPANGNGHVNGDGLADQDNQKQTQQ